MKRLANHTLGLCALLVLLLQIPLVQARDYGAGHGYFPHHREHFGPIDHWQNGAWHHEHYRGRLGWWWVVGSSWYFYDAPVYPYPDPLYPQIVIQTPPVAPPPAAASAQVWYYCKPAAQYYPYVTSCPSNWEVVPAHPPR